MAVAAVVEDRHEVFVRRFDTADFSKHGKWLLPRMVQHTGMTEQAAAGWLRNFVFSNEHMFLYQDHAVALAQAVRGYGLRNQLIIQEQFVWVEDRESKSQLADAAAFYDHLLSWARLQGAEQLIAMEASDVPQPLIEERIGRLFKFETRYARVK